MRRQAAAGRRQAAVPGGPAMQAPAGGSNARGDDPRAGELGRGPGAQQETACSRERSGDCTAQWQHPCLVVIERHLCGGCKLLKRAEATTGCYVGWAGAETADRKVEDVDRSKWRLMPRPQGPQALAATAAACAAWEATATYGAPTLPCCIAQDCLPAVQNAQEQRWPAIQGATSVLQACHRTRPRALLPLAPQAAPPPHQS